MEVEPTVNGRASYTGSHGTLQAVLLETIGGPRGATTGSTVRWIAVVRWIASLLLVALLGYLA